jgi:hypothetical protein
MANAGKIVVHVDATEFQKTIDDFMLRLSEHQLLYGSGVPEPRGIVQGPDSVLPIVATVAVAAGSTRKVSRRAILGLWRR